jgi:hypothetical protein
LIAQTKIMNKTSSSLNQLHPLLLWEKKKNLTHNYVLYLLFVISGITTNCNFKTELSKT